jgi:hypothetical protein
MLYAYNIRFDVTKNLQKFLELNKDLEKETQLNRANEHHERMQSTPLQLQD